MKLNNNNYFSQKANREYISVSQYKSFQGCEARELACLKGEWFKNNKSEALMFGSLLHKWNESEAEFVKFIADNPEIVSSRGITKGQLKSTYKKIYTLIDKIKNDKLFTKALEGQKEVIFTTEMFGTQWKICIDSYNPECGYFTDLKAVAGLHDRFYNEEYQGYVGFIQHYGYDLQMVIYSEIERLATGRSENLSPYLAAITKQEPPDIAIYKGFLEYKDIILADVESKTSRIIELKTGLVKPKYCGKCDYCRYTKKASIIKYKR